MDQPPAQTPVRWARRQRVDDRRIIRKQVRRADRAPPGGLLRGRLAQPGGCRCVLRRDGDRRSEPRWRRAKALPVRALLGWPGKPLHSARAQAIPGGQVEARALLAAIPGTAEDQPVLRPRQRHIKQAPGLALGGAFRLKACCRQAARILILARRPDRHSIDREQRTRRARRGRSGVRQDHDGCLQALGAMHGHHPHRTAGFSEIPLDLAGISFHRREEGLQGRTGLAVMGKRAREQRLDRVARRRAETRTDPVPAGLRALHRPVEHRREELKRRQGAPLEHPFQKSTRCVEDGVLGRLQPRPQALRLALMGEREEMLVVIHQVAERAAQDFRQRQVIFRHQSKADEIEQVLHADMIFQGQPVRAGHGQVLALQFLDQGIKKPALALAHQDQHVTGLSRLARPGPVGIFHPDGLTPVDQRAHFSRHLSRKPRLGGILAHGIHRRLPGVVRIELDRRFDRPELDTAGLVGASGLMAHAVGLFRHEP